MTLQQFNTLLGMFSTKIQKQETDMKDACNSTSFKVGSDFQFFSYWKERLSCTFFQGFKTAYAQRYTRGLNCHLWKFPGIYGVSREKMTKRQGLHVKIT